MPLTKVTITGADDSTDVSDLLGLSKEFPFVEWGVLVSWSSEGHSRFPTRNWINVLLQNSLEQEINLSTHMCGRWVRDLMFGDLDWSELPLVVDASQRVQINFHGEAGLSHRDFIDNLKEKSPREFIFQWDGVNDHYSFAALLHGIKVSSLYDISHGAGVLPDKWIKPSNYFATGYAGGLSPDNVVQNLYQINKICPKDFWIDMETNVRTPEGQALDIKKVRKVLELCAPFINQ
jgi:hypothetical protein